MLRAPVKVCGLTRSEDARLAVELGADCLGFIFYAPSPRSISLEQFKQLDLPDVPKVAVDVMPSREKLEALKAAGFDFFQFHGPWDTDPRALSVWTELVGVDRLWLAPKLPPDAPFPDEWLPHANTFMVDTYTSNGFGGSGKVGDWGRYQSFKTQYRDKTWILAGGLSAENVAEALDELKPDRVDLSSSIESAPGIKDAAKMRAFFEQLQEKE